MIKLVLPWPPTVNHYWGRRRDGNLYVAKPGQEFRAHALIESYQRKARGKCNEGRLAVTVHAHPADNRRRDLDNVLKALLDAITHAGVWADDSQIDDLHIKRESVIKGGRVVVEIEAL